MIHVDLFSGIGGIALAASWAGFRTALFCEIDPYCTRVLARHWPEVPVHDDVRTLTRETLQGHGVGEVTLLTGGFPCQPFSSAGKRRGKADHRHLWPAMLRVIRECRPAWVVGENVAGFVRLALDDVLLDLEGEGYACRAFLVPACGVGAPHRRERCFVVARDAGRVDVSSQRQVSLGPHAEPGGAGAAVADARSKRSAHDDAAASYQPKGRWTELRSSSWWRSEPRVGRVVDGVPRRVDRLRGLGNAVVPQQVYPILAGIADLERVGACLASPGAAA